MIESSSFPQGMRFFWNKSLIMDWFCFFWVNSAVSLYFPLKIAAITLQFAPNIAFFQKTSLQLQSSSWLDRENENQYMVPFAKHDASIINQSSTVVSGQNFEFFSVRVGEEKLNWHLKEISVQNM